MKNGCPWHPLTTWGAAYHGHRNCLKFIFENCKEWTDIGTWEDSGLEEYFSRFSPEIKKYVRSIQEEWKWYSERDQNIKG